MMSNTKDKTVIKPMGFTGCGMSATPASVDIKDGKVVRIRPFHYDEHTPDGLWDKYSYKIEKDGHVFDPTAKSLIPPFSIGYKKRTFSKNRIPYPLKRVDWDPSGERNPQNRGISKYERITWDQALDIIASEIVRVNDKYGLHSIYCQGDGHGETKVYEGAHGCNIEMLKIAGGATIQARQPDSWEGWYWGAKWMWGMDPVGKCTNISNTFQDTVENSDAILNWGNDPDATPWPFTGMISGRMHNFLTEVGVKQIFICPDVNYGAAVHADKWIPVLPNTDSALQLAIAYVWLTEGTYQRDYLDTHAVGFDWFEYHVMGKDDGIPKTPQWAETKCGIRSFEIKALARYWAKHRVSIVHGDGGSMIRAAFSHEPARLEVALLGMQGVGRPGANQWYHLGWGMLGLPFAQALPPSKYDPVLMGAFNGWMFDVGDSFIPKTMLPQAIRLGQGEKIDWYGRCVCVMPTEDQLEHFEFPKEGKPGIRMIWSDCPCWQTCWNGGNELIDALRHDNLEFFLVQHPWMENDTTYADIILPVSTVLEVEDLGNDTSSGLPSAIFLAEQACNTVGEAKSDYAIVCDVARALEKHGGVFEGLFDKYTQGLDREGFYNRGLAMSGIPDEENVTLDYLRKNKVWLSPIREDWADMPHGMIGFCEDPDNNPLATPSGKLEYYSSRIAQNWPDDNIRGPYPKWIEKGDRHDDRWDSDRAQEYPFLLVSNHPRWRIHAQMNDIPWLHEIETCKIQGPDGYFYEPVWVNPIDAKKLDLKQNEICELFNERGTVLGAVRITERVRPGVVLQDHGATADALVGGNRGIDRGGANNLIAPLATASKNAVGEVTSGYLVGLRKTDITALRKEYPMAFERDYDNASGFVFGPYFEEGTNE
jgi:trimethylamine-N-oxide reductase (cytochrome c)